MTRVRNLIKWRKRCSYYTWWNLSGMSSVSMSLINEKHYEPLAKEECILISKGSPTDQKTQGVKTGNYSKIEVLWNQ